MVKVRADDYELCMEADTGAAHTLMSEKTFESLWGRSLFLSTIGLQSYTREPIPVKVCCYVNVAYEGQTGEMPLLIVEGSCPTQFRIDWLSFELERDSSCIHSIYTVSLQYLFAHYPSVFREGGHRHLTRVPSQAAFGPKCHTTVLSCHISGLCCA